MTNGLSHPYHLDESTSILRGIRRNFSFLFYFSMNVMQANRIAPDVTPRFAASHLVLFFLPMSHKMTPGLNGLNKAYFAVLLLSFLFFAQKHRLWILDHVVYYLIRGSSGNTASKR